MRTRYDQDEGERRAALAVGSTRYLISEGFIMTAEHLTQLVKDVPHTTLLLAMCVDDCWLNALGRDRLCDNVLKRQVQGS